MSKIKIKSINLNHEKVELPFEIEINEIKTKPDFSPQVQMCSILTEVVIGLIKGFLKREKES